jgi:hypothetical protein
VDVDGLVLQVLPVADSDAKEMAELADGLHAELLHVDSASVAPLTAEAARRGLRGSTGRLPAGCWSSSAPPTACAPWSPPCADGPYGRAGP